MTTAHFYDTRITHVNDVPTDLANTLADALTGLRDVTPPDATDFNDLTFVISRTSRLLQHLEAFRELAIVAADDTSPHADRKAIAKAAGIPPSRLYRILDRHGRPTVRGAAKLNEAVQGLGKAARDLAAAVEMAHEATEGLNLPEEESCTSRPA
jgi:hypothetical protein